MNQGEYHRNSNKVINDLPLFAEMFDIPMAEPYEEGVPVQLHYTEKTRSFGNFNGGTPLQEERPWEIVKSVARFIVQRQGDKPFTIRLIYVKGEYKLKDLTWTPE